jgi:hypothetical protein
MRRPGLPVVAVGGVNIGMLVEKKAVEVIQPVLIGMPNWQNLLIRMILDCASPPKLNICCGKQPEITMKVLSTNPREALPWSFLADCRCQT